MSMMSLADRGANVSRFGASQPTSVLLGIMSGNRHRREALRCVFGHVRWTTTLLASTLSPVRVLFVVGEHGEASKGDAHDRGRHVHLRRRPFRVRLGPANLKIAVR